MSTDGITYTHPDIAGTTETYPPSHVNQTFPTVPLTPGGFSFLVSISVSVSLSHTFVTLSDIDERVHYQCYWPM